MNQEEIINHIKDVICSSTSELKRDVMNSLIDSRIVRFSNLYPSITSIIPRQILLDVDFVEASLYPVYFNSEETIILIDKQSNRYKFYPYYESQCLPCTFSKEVINDRQLKITFQGLHEFFYLNKDFIDIWLSNKSVFDCNHYYQAFINATFELRLHTNEGELNKSIRVKQLDNKTFSPDFTLKNKINTPDLFTAFRLEFTNDISHLQIYKVEVMVNLKNNIKTSVALLNSLYFNRLAIINCYQDFASNIMLDACREQYPLLNEMNNNAHFHSIKEVYVKSTEGNVKPVFHKLISNNKDLSYEIKALSANNGFKHAHIFFHNLDPMLHHQIIVNANWYDDISQELQAVNFIKQPVNMFNSGIAKQFPIVNKQENNLQLINQITDILHKSTLSRNEILQIINLLTENKYHYLSINKENKITNLDHVGSSANEIQFYETVFTHCKEYVNQLKM